ncbi:hypothetical protein [Cupriavidus metallidurans]|uniref:hypothetical protein n=1 Tax=Cupriavidus metallidurans TaxID=119219 RepID=UPI001CC91061|nr:hypothetical protein [Cupriavidus metallidurans]UBM12792.1 hypothetical protein LAI70_27960 [Cupriavidus metallidurans]
MTTTVYAVLIEEEGCNAYVERVCRGKSAACSAALQKLHAIRKESIETANGDCDPDDLVVRRFESNDDHWVLTCSAGQLAAAIVMSCPLE